MSHLQITEIIENKNKYMDLLFLADEQETMIDKYLQRGMMYGLFDNGIKQFVLSPMKVKEYLR